MNTARRSWITELAYAVPMAAMLALLSVGVATAAYDTPHRTAQVVQLDKVTVVGHRLTTTAMR